MPMVNQCAEPGCETLTMGRLCLEHELLLGAAPIAVRREPDLQHALSARLGQAASPGLRTASASAAAAPRPR